MIKVIFDKGKIARMECKCGNISDFGKYESFDIVIGERMRKTRVKKHGISCLKKYCRAILTQDELDEQLKGHVNVPALAGI